MNRLITQIRKPDHKETHRRAVALRSLLRSGSRSGTLEERLSEQAQIFAVLLEAAATAATEHDMCPKEFSLLARDIGWGATP